jgi:hypothetical protein
VLAEEKAKRKALELSVAETRYRYPEVMSEYSSADSLAAPEQECCFSIVSVDDKELEISTRAAECIYMREMLCHYTQCPYCRFVWEESQYV